MSTTIIEEVEKPDPELEKMHPERSTTIRNIGLIAAREYKNQVSRRSYVVISCIYLALIIIGSFVPTILQVIQARSSSQTKMVVINNAGEVAGMSGTTLQQSIEAALNEQGNSGTSDAHFIVTTGVPATLEQIKGQVKDGQLDFLLVIDRNASREITFAYYTTTSNPADGDTVQVLRMAGQLSIRDRAEELHLSSSEVASLFAQPPFAITDLQDNQDGRSLAEWITGMVLAYAGIILIFISNLLYGVGVAQGVAEEKGKHIMEILLLAASPFQLMVGKIIGIGLAGLTQLLALVLVGIAMFALQLPIQSALLGNSMDSTGLMSITGASVTMLLLVLLYFILGFTLYASLYAAAGALVQQQEEAQGAGTPISFLFAIGYIMSVSLVAVPGVPDATWFKIMSYIPFWSPTMMLARIGTGVVAWWEIALTVLMMLLIIPLCAWLSARIYRSGVLMYGQGFKSRQFVRLLRAG